MLNEPDNPDYWLGSVEQFSELLRVGSAAIHEANPSAKVVMGGLAWNLRFLEAMLTNPSTFQNTLHANAPLVNFIFEFAFVENGPWI